LIYRGIWKNPTPSVVFFTAFVRGTRM